MASSGEAVTYRELNDRSNRLAQLFFDAGLRFGDHIAVLMENRREYFEPCWAAQRSGLFFTCINSHFNADEVAYILDDCDAQVLVVSRRLREVAAELVDKMPGVKVRLVVGDAVDGYEPYEDAIAPLSRRAARGGARRHADAVLVGHDGTTEGREVQDLAPARRRAAGRDGDDDDRLGHGRRRRLPVARAAVPLGAALLLHEHDAPRRHRHRDGAVRSRGRARSASRSTT